MVECYQFSSDHDILEFSLGETPLAAHIPKSSINKFSSHSKSLHLCFNKIHHLFSEALLCSFIHSLTHQYLWNICCVPSLTSSVLGFRKINPTQTDTKGLFTMSQTPHAELIPVFECLQLLCVAEEEGTGKEMSIISALPDFP